MKIGDHIKVGLPGERPWAQVTEVTEKGFKGRIDNILVSEGCEFTRRRHSKYLFGVSEPLPKLHDFKFNDVVSFVKEEGRWVPELNINK